MAATVVLLGSIFNTTAGSKSVTATPNSEDLIVIVAAHSGNTATTVPTDNQSPGSTYALVTSVLKNTSADILTVYTRHAFIQNNTSTTWTHNPGTTTGGGFAVYAIRGVAKSDVGVVRQAAQQANIASGTPAPVFSSAILTGNPVISAVFNGTSPGGIAARSSPAYTRDVNLGYSTPTAGFDTMHINSGETGTTMTWGSSSASPFASIAIEIDASSAQKIDFFQDNFIGSSLDTTKWFNNTQSGGTMSVGSGAVTLTAPATTAGALAEIESLFFYTLTSSRVFVKASLTQVANVNAEAKLVVYKDELGNQLQISVRNGNFVPGYINAGAETDLATITYNSSTMAWWSIAESGGTISWQYSADGINWTTAATLATGSSPIDITYVRTSVAIFNAISSGTAEIGVFSSYSINSVITLFDNFDDNSIDSTKWTTGTGGTTTIAETNSRIQIALPASATAADFAELDAAHKYDFTGGSISVQAVQVANTATAADTDLRIQTDTSNLFRWVEESGTLFAQYLKVGARTTAFSVAYSSTTHAWWRISESGGVVTWWTSTDGITWTSRATFTHGMVITSMTPILLGSCFQAETSPGTIIFDNFNLSLVYSTTAIFTDLIVAVQYSTTAVLTTLEKSAQKSTVAISSTLERTKQESVTAILTTLEKTAQESVTAVLTTLEKAAQRSTTAVLTTLESTAKSTTAILTTLEEHSTYSTTGIVTTLEKSAQYSTTAILSTLEKTVQSSTAGILTTLEKSAQKSTTAIVTNLEANKLSTTAILTNLEGNKPSTTAISTTLEKSAQFSTVAIFANLENAATYSTAAVLTTLEKSAQYSTTALLTTFEKILNVTTAVFTNLEGNKTATVAIFTSLEKSAQYSTTGILTSLEKSAQYSTTAILTTFEVVARYSTTAVLTSLEGNKLATTAILTTFEKVTLSTTAVLTTLERVQVSTSAVLATLEKAITSNTALLTTLEKSAQSSTTAVLTTLEKSAQKSTTAVLTTLEGNVVSTAAILTTLEKTTQGTTAIFTNLEGVASYSTTAILTVFEAHATYSTAAIYTAFDLPNVYSKNALVNLPADTTDLIYYTAQEVINVATEDGLYANQNSIGGAIAYMIHQYRNHAQTNTGYIQATWIGKTTDNPSIYPVSLQIYNFNTMTWETIVTYTTATVNTNFTMTGLITINQSNYYDANNYVAWRVYQKG